MIAGESLAVFLDNLSSDKPAPGGGTASAVAGAMGAALVGMVARLTRGGPGGRLPIMREVAEAADSFRAELARLAEEDAAAFLRVMSAYALPREDEEQSRQRRREIAAALEEAARVPLRVAGLCVDVLKVAVATAEQGNPSAASDAGVAALLAGAALRGAGLNVRANLPRLEGGKAQEMLTLVEAYESVGGRLEAAALQNVQQALARPLTPRRDG